MKVVCTSEQSKWFWNIGRKVIPLEAKLLSHVWFWSKPIDNAALMSHENEISFGCKPKWNKLWTLDEIPKAIRSALFVNGPYCWLWEGVKWLRFKIKLGVFSDKILFKCITSTPGWLLAAGWWLGGNKSRVFSAAARRSGAEMETEWRDNLHHRDTGLRRVTTTGSP